MSGIGRQTAFATITLLHGQGIPGYVPVTVSWQARVCINYRPRDRILNIIIIAEGPGDHACRLQDCMPTNHKLSSKQRVNLVFAIGGEIHVHPA